MTDIEKIAREAIDLFTSPHYEYGEHRPVESYSLAKWVAKAVAERCAEIADWRSAVQQDRAKAEGNDYASERAIEAKACASAIRKEFGLEEKP